MLALLLGSLLIALGLAVAVGPVRLIAGMVAVPIVWALVTVVAVALWIGLRVH